MTVTPRKDAAGPSPPSPDEDGSEAARAAADDASAPRDPPGILLHGFCRSVKELRDDPHRMIEEVRSMLAKARECEGDSEGEKFYLRIPFGVTWCAEARIPTGGGVGDVDCSKAIGKQIIFQCDNPFV